jgi:hypothetical protein
MRRACLPRHPGRRVARYFSTTTIGTAEKDHNRVIERYEETTLARGEVPGSMLIFVVIGGEATEVETASDLHELIHDVIAPATRT